MDFQDCIKFTNEHRTCYLATVDEEGWPRVRAMRMWFADNKGFHFATHESKMLYKQLEVNNRVEACFYAPNPGGGLAPIMRVCRETEFINDMEYKRRLLEDRSVIKKRYRVEKEEDPGPVIFRIYKGEAYFWTLDYNLCESEIERVHFGE